MRFIIASRDRAQYLLSNSKTAPDIGAVVSIGGPGSPKPKGLSKKPYLRLEFNDIEENTHSIRGQSVTPPTDQDIQRLIDSAPSLLATRGQILCHCHHGISRSSAAAYILDAISKGKGHEQEALRELVQAFPKINPNSLMIKIASRLLNNPDLLEAYNMMFS